MSVSPGSLTLASHVIKKSSLGNHVRKKTPTFLTGRVHFLQFDLPGDGNRDGVSVGDQHSNFQQLKPLQAHSAQFPAQHSMPKNGLQENQPSGPGLPALTHRKPRGRDRPDLAALQNAASVPGTTERCFFPTAIYYPDPS